MDALMRKQPQFNFCLPYEYTGEVNEKGQPDGYGIARFKDGTLYRGRWKEGQMIDFGLLLLKNGSIYLG